MRGRLLLAVFLLVPAGAPAQVPQNLTASGSDQEVSLTWDAPAVDDGVMLVCYRVYRDTTSIPDDDPADQSALRIAEISASDGGDPAYTDSDVINGRAYFYRVTVETAETDAGTVACGDSETEESDFSNQASATPAPTALQITEPAVPVSGPINAGTAVEVTVQGTNVPSGEPVQLRYRQGGEASFTTETMSGTGTEFTASIPGTAVTARGVEFVVTTRTEEGDEVRIPADGIASIRVQAETLSFTQPGGTAQSAYRMVSFPTQLSDARLSTLFDALAPYDPVEWRLFSVSDDGFTSSGGGYVEQSDLSATLEAGQGIWLISRSGATLGPVQGTSVRTDRDYQIPLHQGWNLIGNPFAFEVPVSQLRAVNTDGTLQEVFGYTGTFVPKTGNDAIAPYQGALVRLSGGQTGTLVIDPTRDDSGASPQNAAPRTAWHVDVSARIDRAHDVVNTFGVAPGAGDGIDPVDGREPPPVGDYVSLAFRSPVQNAMLWRDVRGAGTALQTWTAAVRTNVSGRVTLRATDLGAVPEEKAVWLVDPALNLTRNLRETPQYRFPALEEETTRRLRFLVGSPAAVQEALGRDGAPPQRVRLLPAVPHPVRSHATLRYEVPEPTRVTLEVYDLLGRRVATLVDDRRVEVGTHAFPWTPGAGGQAVSSGTYVLRLRAGDVTRTRRLVVVR